MTPEVADSEWLRVQAVTYTRLQRKMWLTFLKFFTVATRCWKCWESRWKWNGWQPRRSFSQWPCNDRQRYREWHRHEGQAKSVLQGHPGARWNLLAPTCKVKDIAFDEVWKLTGLLYGRVTISSYRIAEGAMLLIHLSAVSALVQSKTETEWQNGEASFRFQRILLLRGVCIPGNRCRFQLWCHRCFSDPAYDKFQQVSGQGDVLILTQIYSVWNFNGILVQRETQTCRLATIQLCATTRERIKEVGTWTFSGPKVRDKPFAISVSLSFPSQSIIMGCLHQHDQPGRCCIAKFPAIAFSDAISFHVMGMQNLWHL